jgi:hypothetical protein
MLFQYTVGILQRPLFSHVDHWSDRGMPYRRGSHFHGFWSVWPHTRATLQYLGPGMPWHMHANNSIMFHIVKAAHLLVMSMLGWLMSWPDGSHPLGRHHTFSRKVGAPEAPCKNMAA